MKRKKPDQKGAAVTAEGSHGPTSHAAFVESLHHRADDGLEADGSPRKGPRTGTPIEGHHRLSENREQHDTADKKREKNRKLHRGKS